MVEGINNYLYLNLPNIDSERHFDGDILAALRDYSDGKANPTQLELIKVRGFEETAADLVKTMNEQKGRCGKYRVVEDPSQTR